MTHSRSPRRSSRSSHNKPLRFESLEPRLLLAADLAAPQQVAEEYVAEGESITTLAQFAQSLTDAGVKFFGSVLCPVCDRQKDQFGSGADNLNHIEVLNPDGSLNATGQAEGISVTPTWEYPDGTRAEGFQTLDQLAEGAGVPLPTNIVVLQTNFGDIELELQPQAAPQTVDNFLNYANDGDYDQSIFHRLVSGFVLQGGGFVTTNEQFTSTAQFASIPTDPPVQNEFNLSNLRGTVAMAKLGGNPDSATNQFFFNLGNNAGNLDNQNGGFTVFAVVNDMTLVDQLATVGRLNAGSPFNDLPINGDGRLLVVNSVTGSGEVRGVVFDDADLDGVQDNGEQGVSGATIYVDANDNGSLDSGELSTTSAADGSYVITVEAGARVIRQQLGTNVAATISQGRIPVDVEIGRTSSNVNFGEFDVPAVPGIDLVDGSDTGSNITDNVTNRDNSTPGRAFDILATGAVDGALVRLFADGVQIAQATANSNVVISSGGSQTLTGAVTLSADQVVNGVAGPRTTTLPITIDNAINAISSAAPTGAKAGDDLDYDVQHDEEGSGLIYSLTTAPAGASINSATGVISWIPTNAQEGDHDFVVLATDLAGNTTTQSFTVSAISNELIRVDFKTTNLAGSEITSVNVGEEFLLQAFVSDRRITPQGVAGAFFDVLYANNLVTPNGAPVFEADFDLDQEFGDTTQLGLIDEIGARSTNGTAANGNPVLMFSLPVSANIAGTETFSGDGADDLPANASSLVGQAVSPAEFKFNAASINILASFGANGDLFGVDEDAEDASLDVLLNDQQFQSSSGDLVISAVGPTSAGGVVTIAGDFKSLTYSPADDYFGIETFVYTLTDGTSSDTGFVVVNVQSVNDPPNAQDDNFSVNEDDDVTSLDVQFNDNSDPDPPESVTITAVGTPDNGGEVSIGAAGSIVRYKPAANFTGMEKFTYTLTDTLGAMKTATVTVDVQSVNDPPTAVNDSFPINEDDPAADFKPLANDSTAPDMGETLRITSVSGGLPGALVELVDDETIRYRPPADAFGADVVSYTIDDGNGGVANALINFSIANVNDDPVAVADTLAVVKNAPVTTVDVLMNDHDGPDNEETLSIQSFTQGTNGGTVALGPNGTLTYQPPANYSGPDEFSYTIRDGNGGSDTALVSVDVRDFVPSRLGGFVFVEQNNDGVFDAGETPVGGVTVRLFGTSPVQGPVDISVQTAADGSYSFINLPPGDYEIEEQQPQFMADGQDSIGTAGGSLVANDHFSITVPEGTVGENYNFAELGRNAQFSSLADFLVRQRQQAMSNTNASVETLTVSGVADWYILGPGWSQFSSAESQLVQPTEVALTVADGDGAMQTRNVSTPAAEVRLLAANATTFFARVTGDFTTLGFAAPAMGSPEAEAEGSEANEIAAAFGDGSDLYVIGEGEPAFASDWVDTAPRPTLPVIEVRPAPTETIQEIVVLDTLAAESQLLPAGTRWATPVTAFAGRGERVDAVFNDNETATEEWFYALADRADEEVYRHDVDEVLQESLADLLDPQDD